MQITVDENGSSKIAIVVTEQQIFTDVSSVLDFMAEIHYNYDCEKIIVQKSDVSPDFFILSNTIAGQILQKFINYHMKLAIVGDFSNVQSKSLKDFIYESNKGKDIFFLPSVDTALEKLHSL